MADRKPEQGMPAPQSPPATKRSRTKSTALAATAQTQPPVNAVDATQEASRVIDGKIQALQDWRGATLAEVRRLIHEADPEVQEELKWRGTPVWSHAGILCTGEIYKQVVKLTFAKGASLADPAGLFNSSLEGNVRRAIDLREGARLPATAFKRLIVAAVTANRQASAAKTGPSGKSRRKSTAIKNETTGTEPATTSKVVLLSGGNPQIAKADGDAPVQAYIAAMPGWKSGLGTRLDSLITTTVPEVRKAVKWNSPFYGIEGQGWFLSFHVLTRYVKVTFFNGISLDPLPPGGTAKSKEARWIDLYEDDVLDESLLTSWIQQAAALPGWTP